MAKTEEVTPYYLRMQTGECFYVDTLKEALQEFLGDEGYRLTLSSGGNEMVIRRTSEWKNRIIQDVQIDEEESCTANIVRRSK